MAEFTYEILKDIDLNDAAICFTASFKTEPLTEEEHMKDEQMMNYITPILHRIRL